MLARPLDKGHLHATDALQRFAGQVAPALALAVRIQTAFLIGAVQHVLQHAGGQVADAPRTDHRQDVVAPELLHLLDVAGATRGFDRNHVLGPHVCAALCGAADALIQPGVGLAVRFALAGPTGFCAGKGPAHAVLLHLDLPAVLVR